MYTQYLRRTFLKILLTVAVAAMPALASSKSFTVTAPDGVPIAVRETGDPNGPAVVLVHGLLGSHLSWDAQWHSPALQRFRLITFDLRGHGQSGMPAERDSYREGRRWADDLAAVIKATQAKRPVLVGWSLGAAIITNYLAAYGDDAILGVLYVGGVVELRPELLVPQPAVYESMASTDLKMHLDGERAFIELCFKVKPDAHIFQRLVANAAMASPSMQNAVHGMDIDAEKGLGSLHKPLLLIYGEHDALVQPDASFKRARALAPHAVLRSYAGSGHAPFLEEPARFDRDLAAFVGSVAR